MQKSMNMQDASGGLGIRLSDMRANILPLRSVSVCNLEAK
jgi:hypothetical protein